MDVYRETLFARALERLVSPGGFQAAYLVSREGLVWAKTKTANRQNDVAALTAAVASFFERAAAAGFPLGNELVVPAADGPTFTFLRFTHAGEEERELFVAALSAAADGETAALKAVAEEIKRDLEAFY